MTPYLQNLTFRLADAVGRLTETDRQQHAKFIRKQQRTDGGFAGREGESDLCTTWRARIATRTTGAT